MTATNNFARDTKIGEGGFGSVYRGRFTDGREVAIKRSRHPASRNFEDEFLTEVAILSLLRHNNIARLLGSCWSMDKDKRLLSFWTKKLERAGPERLLVYEYMENGSLYDHLHRELPSSLVTASWKKRIDVLLGVSRAIEHLHCHAVPPVIHRDIKSSNILLDSSWVPHLSDFGVSLHWDTMKEDETHAVLGTYGYADPEYIQTGRLKPASDVYSLGVLMLEVLAGKHARFFREKEGTASIDLVSFALPMIEAGDLEELLDKRPAPKPARGWRRPQKWPRQLQALEYVAQTAACCVQMQGKDRPAISEVVASLEAVLEFMCSHDSSVDEVLCTRPKMWDYLRPLQNYSHESVTVPALDPPEESGGALSDTEFTEPR
jgi:serine/threonine protein kinase